LIKALLGKGQDWTDQEAEMVLESPVGRHIAEMVTYAAIGTPDDVKEYLERFARHADADELMVAHHAPTVGGRLRSVELLASTFGQKAA
jgi:alkanesulfonate monooxygenase SsuD/methylene tetrahydromethanopterin reductase-like flavin-dependent oxidoreductase (luciferase family)